jgi:hypothetical protein
MTTISGRWASLFRARQTPVDRAHPVRHRAKLMLRCHKQCEVDHTHADFCLRQCLPADTPPPCKAASTGPLRFISLRLPCVGRIARRPRNITQTWPPSTTSLRDGDLLSRPRRPRPCPPQRSDARHGRQGRGGIEPDASRRLERLRAQQADGARQRRRPRHRARRPRRDRHRRPSPSHRCRRRTSASSASAPPASRATKATAAPNAATSP